MHLLANDIPQVISAPGAEAGAEQELVLPRLPHQLAEALGGQADSVYGSTVPDTSPDMKSLKISRLQTWVILTKYNTGSLGLIESMTETRAGHWAWG